MKPSDGTTHFNGIKSQSESAFKMLLNGCLYHHTISASKSFNAFMMIC
ncbi:hypothetical protein HDEF_0662 [Candidatus Hamiltonella defensa 5AT (Acyrthosiphon pisum)]|uniref:Uncharacterized protein n=1 Tax=Hamiltonella defensa subsp. Acyrthosiphon pisum (strain 5AT) TaxID=572265 RepID=C4K4A9_HAMD5|nr:hypothetical protein HDEF_0662 [Candidatus Hamiltonella defensa 5AT (Acyrthosiphon pisum)]